ncbi:hypothetical protein, partial [Desulfatiferula olefinivorans]
ISVEDFKMFSEECMRTMRTLWDSFKSSGNIEWREFAARKIGDARLGNDDILTRLTSKKLSSLAHGK